MSVRSSKSVYDYHSAWFVSFDTYAHNLSKSTSDECKWHCFPQARKEINCLQLLLSRELNVNMNSSWQLAQSGNEYVSCEGSTHTSTIHLKRYLLNDGSCWIQMIENDFHRFSIQALPQCLMQTNRLSPRSSTRSPGMKFLLRSIESSVLNNISNYSRNVSFCLFAKFFFPLFSFAHCFEASMCCRADNNFTNILSWWRMLLNEKSTFWHVWKHFSSPPSPARIKLKDFSEHFPSFPICDSIFRKGAGKIVFGSRKKLFKASLQEACWKYGKVMVINDVTLDSDDLSFLQFARIVDINDGSICPKTQVKTFLWLSEILFWLSSEGKNSSIWWNFSASAVQLKSPWLKRDASTSNGSP